MNNDERGRAFRGMMQISEIEFAEWTPDEPLSHAAFLGLRIDRKPKKVVRET
jgi:ATP-dependent DNA ligase